MGQKSPAALAALCLLAVTALASSCTSPGSSRSARHQPLSGVGGTSISNAPSAIPTALSCASDASCLLIGQARSPGEANDPIAWQYFAGTWKPLNLPTGGSLANTALSQVSCVSHSACLVIGHSLVANTATYVSAFWNGTGWLVSQLPDSAGGVFGRDSLSCSAGNRCVEVGHIPVLSRAGGTTPGAETSPISSPVLSPPASPKTSQTNGYQSYAAIWQNSSWSELPTSPIPSPSTAFVAGFDQRLAGCDPTGTCVILASPSDIYATLRDSEWSPILRIEPSAGVYQSIDCPQPAFCLAVGATRSSPPRALSAAWNGSAWQTDVARDYTGSLFSRVSCAASTNCFGVLQTESANYALLRWDGNQWSTVTIPDGFHPEDISCSSPSQCISLGIDPAGRPGLQQWTGSAWTASTLPAPFHSQA